MNKARIILGALAGSLLLTGAALAQSGPPQTIQTPPKSAGSEEIIIPPETKRATSPDGDPRSRDQISADQTAFDQCILRAPERDMAHPVDSTPEEYCSQRLGMSDRNAVPNSVLLPKSNRRP